MTTKKVSITTLTFRDGPQSTGMWDGYFRLFRKSLTEWKDQTNGESLLKLKRIAALVKATGFVGAEVFWGQSFQKYMLAGIDPFEAMELHRVVFGNDFMLSGLGRGINAVGFRPYGQDVIDTFVARFAERGGVAGEKLIKMRIFDALNNIQNCATMISAAIRHNQRQLPLIAESQVSEVGGAVLDRAPKLIHVEAALSYQPERQYQGHTLYSDDYYIEYARELVGVAEKSGGALDSLVIKDMAGQLDPKRTARLLPKLLQLGLPVYLHTHCTNYPQAVATMRVAADHGIAGVETVEWPLSGGTSHASVREVIEGKENTFADIDLTQLSKLEKELESLFGSSSDLFSQEGDPQARRLDLRLDEASRRELWNLGIPGGAMAAVMNLLQKEVCTHKKTTLKQATALFAAELEHLQNRIGWVPLVTPMADIIYTQAIINVINGRDRIIEHRYAKMVLGLYGAHIDHATGKRVPIDDLATTAVLNYCQGVHDGDTGTPSFGMSYPPPEVVVEPRLPAPELNQARSAISELLQRADIGVDSVEADEASIMRLMEPPASAAATEQVLLRSAQESIKRLIWALDVGPANTSVQAIEDALAAYGGISRAETFARRLLAMHKTPPDILDLISLEARAFQKITHRKYDTEQLNTAIARLIRAVLENRYLVNQAANKSDQPVLPFGPENALYFLQSAIDPYSSTAKMLLQDHWPNEYAAVFLYNAVKKGLPFDGQGITDDAA